MGSLSNLYISQSFQSLIKLASDTGASGTSTQLQDGLGTNIGVYVNTNGEVSASSFSGSVTGIGNVSAFSSSVNSRILAVTGSTIDTGSLVTTASFNAYTSSTNSEISAIESFTASVSTSVGLLQTFSGSQYKADSSSFNSRIISAENTGYVTTASFNSYTQSTNTFTASISTSVGLLQTFSGSQYKADSASFSSRIEAVTGSSTNTGSLLLTASFDNGTRNLTFTKGDSTTFNVNIPDVSGSTGNFATTGSNVFVGNQTITGSLLISGSEVLRGTLSASALRVENNTYLDGTLTVTNDTLINGDVTIQSATPNLKLRDTSGGGFSSGYDLRVDTGSFEIYDDTHDRDVLSDFFNSASQQHTTSLTSEIIVISGSTSVTLLGNVSASIISASTINGLGDPLAFSTSVDSRLDNLELGSSSVSTSVGLLQTFSGSQYKNDSSSFDSRINSAGGNVSVQEEGTILGNATSFNFIGAGVTATVSSGTASVTIPGGGSIYTGSFATTGSNSFLGTQTLLETGSWGGVLLNVQSGSIKFNGQVADSGFSGTGSIFLTPVNLPHGSTKVVFQTEYQSGSTTPSGYDYILGIGRQGDTYSKTVDLGTDSTLDVSRANLVGFNFTTTASFNLFSGSQYKNDSASFDTRINGISVDTSSLVSTSSFNAYTQSTNTFTASISTSVGLLQTFSGSEYKGDSSSFNSRIITATINTSSFATTGSNTFVGSQWFSDAADTESYAALTEWSGSLILSAKGYYTASFPQLTSSLAAAAGTGFVNLLFKGDSTAGNTILSGSSNILGNPVAPTATFYRQVGNGNLALLGTLPQVSASMLFPITMNGNVINGTGNPITLRGPVSSSGWTINANNIQGTLNLGSSTALHAEKLVSAVSLTVNNIPGTLSIIANQSTITGSTTILGNTIAGGVTLNLSSSAITMNNNIVNDSSFTLTNQFYSSSVTGFGTLTLSRNNIAGQGNSIIVSGSQPTGTTTTAAISDNFIGGGSNIIYSDIANAAVSGVNAYHNAVRNIVFGNQLIITGSSVPADTNSFGSAFFGRYNDLTGNKDLTSQTIFAVGTGNSTTRKTGLHIDSGSNTFIEGSLNVSGSSTFTGSVATPPVVVTITSDTASIDFSKGSIYTLTLVSSSVATYVTASNLTPGQTANLVVTQASALSGSIVWASAFKFPSGSAYTGSKVVNAVDLISFITVNNTTIYSVGASNLV